MSETVAFLGLGHMGGPMAVNLVKAGYQVLGFDVVPAAVEAAAAQGVPVVGSATEAAAQASIVLTMFPSGKHLLDAYRGGLLAALSRVPCSWTVPPSMWTRRGRLRN